MTAFIRIVRAHVGETVEIQWHLDDGTTCYQRVTIPPQATREAQQQLADSVQDLEAAAGITVRDRQDGTP